MSSIDDNVIVELDNVQKELLLTNLDEDGKLSCLKAFKVARLIGRKPIEMSAITKTLGIKITNCELGVFGKLKFKDPNEDVYNRLKQNYMGHETLECKVLWDEAQKSTLKTVGSTVKNSDIEVSHCQLGCFRTKNGKKKLIRLNVLQYNPIKLDFLDDNYSLDSLLSNEEFDNLCKKYKEKFNYPKLKTFSFSKEGFLGLLLELKGKIALSVGECEALIEGAKLYESLGFKIIWLNLNKDGKVNIDKLKDENIDFLFLSSYVMDTFVKTSLDEIKNITKAKIISNGSAQISTYSDAIYFDNYKLSGYNLSGVLLFNDINFELLQIGLIDTIAVKTCFEALNNQKFNYEMKEKFLQKLKDKLQDNIYFFVEPNDTLPYSLHFGLKGIKARELIRTLALNKIFLTNGEGCSLGYSKPSRIIQEMGYDEITSRNSIHFSFSEILEESNINKIIDKLHLKYMQLKLFV